MHKHKVDDYDALWARIYEAWPVLKGDDDVVMERDCGKNAWEAITSVMYTLPDGTLFFRVGHKADFKSQTTTPSKPTVAIPWGRVVKHDSVTFKSLGLLDVLEGFAEKTRSDGISSISQERMFEGVCCSFLYVHHVYVFLMHVFLY